MTPNIHIKIAQIQIEMIRRDWYERQAPTNQQRREDPYDSERESVLAGLHPTVARRMLDAAREINSGTAT